MTRFARNTLMALVGILGGFSLAALPHAVLGSGLCDPLCGHCYFDENSGQCAYIDDCDYGIPACYFSSGYCSTCPPE